MNKAKAILIFSYIVLLCIPAITVVNNMGGLNNLSSVTKNITLLTYFILQILGLYGLVLLFTQVIVGAFMIPLRRVFGGRFLMWHITQGIVIYCIVVLHPTLYFLFNFQTSGSLQKAVESFLPHFAEADLPLNLGRLGFFCITIGVFAGLLRTRLFLMKYWRAFHYFNYVAFGLLLVHSYLIGQDTKSAPFVWLYPLFVVGLLASFFYRRIIRGFQ